MEFIISIGLFTPLIGFFILMFSSNVISRKLTGLIGCTTIFISLICFTIISYIINEPETVTLFQWIPIENIQAHFSLHIDELSILMGFIITGVGFLIHVYSIGYMEHDEDVTRFFACLNFFVFAILLLVLASNLLLVFVGWEGVGLASYLLIGFWYEKPVAAAAATKAFVVNRVGDLGFLLGLLLTFHLFGTGDIAEVTKQAAAQYPVGAPIITLLTIFYLIGACGKSAQLPLHTWLPDAMAGPTPVSALIHAATMVTAGVYLIVRLHELFVLAPMTLEIIGIIGAATALFAALCALGQTDLKKVLAYSTVSQLGFMFLACGAADFYGAMFHLTMHAFIKALLFLSAGNVLHMTHEITEMEEMGGLAKRLPKTNWLFLIGAIALAGIPPLGAFFSKDLILEQEYLVGQTTLFYIGLIAAILTGVYLTRAYCISFIGPTRMNKTFYNTMVDAPRIMIRPLIILAFLSITGGFLGYSLDGIPLLENFLGKVDIELADPSHREISLFAPQTLEAVIGTLLGIGITAMLYTRFINNLGPTIATLKNAFYIDLIYETVLVRPVTMISMAIANFFEPKFFYGTINIASNQVLAIATQLQKFQSGQIRSYTAWMILGTIATIVYFTF